MGHFFLFKGKGRDPLLAVGHVLGQTKDRPQAGDGLLGSSLCGGNRPCFEDAGQCGTDSSGLMHGRGFSHSH